jgi:hypothetical protein
MFHARLNLGVNLYDGGAFLDSEVILLKSLGIKDDLEIITSRASDFDFTISDSLCLEQSCAVTLRV